MAKQKSKDNFEKVEKSKFSKKNFDSISFGNVNYSKFSKEIINFLKWIALSLGIIAIILLISAIIINLT